MSLNFGSIKKHKKLLPPAASQPESQGIIPLRKTTDQRSESTLAKAPRLLPGKTVPVSRRPNLAHLDRVLFVIACVYLLGVTGWLINAQRRVWQQVVEQETNSEFISYLQRSLQRLENHPPEAPTTEAASFVESVIATTPHNYTPVRPLPELPSLATLPPPPPTVPVMPPPTPVPANPAKPSPEATVTNHKLVGLMELGDRSVALIEFAQTTVHLEIGQSLGSSGWTLEAVNQQTAVFSRNGEKRSISVGQKF